MSASGTINEDHSKSIKQRSFLYDQSLTINANSALLPQTQPTSNITSVVPFSVNTLDPIPGPSQELMVPVLEVDLHGDSITDTDDDDSSQENTRTTLVVKNMTGEPNEELFVEDVENCSPNIVVERGPHEVKLLKSSKKFASSELKFQSFQINWNKISDNIHIRLQDLQKFRSENPNKCAPRSLQLSKTEWSGITSSVVDQLRAIDTEIQASVMEKVAKDIFEKYPCLIILDDDGYDTGIGYGWIKQKMLNRNSYLNRFKNESDESVPTKIDVRQNRNVRAGTNKEYWEKSSKECTKYILSTLARNEPELLTPEFLKASQSYVRYLFDDDKQLKDVLTDFPVLRRKCILNYHFECATGASVKYLEHYFTTKRSKLIDYSKTNRKFTHLDTTASDVDIFRFLCSLLGEKLDDVIILKEIGTKIDGISTDCSGPVLVAIDCGNDKKVYYVFAEQVRLSEGTENVIEAVSDLLCVHYVHNFMYMRQISKFLEFIQQYFFKILPITGSKSNATRKGQQQRVVKKVIKAISEYCAD
ncbi:uncharacterized protein LOC131683615 isoform X2 [Topomyia yanbarensis]|uniref:uncharacterized protein LOC131683615 isoform X2 n=1 Tax=Topomyia yanbarensis TaxID=2498891 RepID=UPI00273A8A10|nr:uncharacterized protein LOC131683615 isoform X2 [Topomyia yanbarensis]